MSSTAHQRNRAAGSRHHSGSVVYAIAVGLAFVSLASPSSAAQPDPRLVGRSVQHRAIPAFVFGNGHKSVLVIGGIHGNERSSVGFIGHFELWVSRHWTPPADCQLIVVPDANPDGHVHGARHNAHDVDLNRNFPARDWGTLPRRTKDYPGPRPASEPETQFILKLMVRFHPRLIVSVHAPYHQINIDGPAMHIAQDMRRFNHDRITRKIGYPTPGSLGTYAGKEKHMPVITLELARRSARAIWRANRPALSAAIDDVCGRSSHQAS